MKVELGHYVLELFLDVFDCVLVQFRQDGQVLILEPDLVHVGELLADDCHELVHIGEDVLVLVLVDEGLLVVGSVEVVGARAHLEEPGDLAEHLQPDLLVVLGVGLEVSGPHDGVDSGVVDDVVVVAGVAVGVLDEVHVLGEEGGGEVGVEEDLVVGYLGELLDDLYEVAVLDVDPP